MRDDGGGLKSALTDASELFHRAVRHHGTELRWEEIGIVTHVGRGIVRVTGLPGIKAEELVRFPGGIFGLAFNIDTKEVGIVLLGEGSRLGAGRDRRTVFAVGARAAARIEDAGQRVSVSFPVPGSASGITLTVQEIFVRMGEWQIRHGMDSLVLYYCRPLSGASYRPHTQHLLPLHEEGFRKLREEKWPSRCIPTFSMEWGRLFSALAHEYLFVSFCRALAESLASENAGRLASMQTAEKSIEERLSELTGGYSRQRQAAITEELLDIIAGFEGSLSG